MRPAACCRGSFPRDTSAKPGTNRIQSRALQANANSHRHRSFQNSADSAAMSSLHPAFFTLSVHFTNLAVSNYGLLHLAMEWKAPTYTRGLAPHQSLVVYPISLYPLKPFQQCVPSCGETLNTTWNGFTGVRLEYQFRALRISSADDESKPQMRSTQSKCSGFMS